MVFEQNTKMMFKNPTIKEIAELIKQDRFLSKHLKYMGNYIVWFSIKLKIRPHHLVYFWTIGQFLACFLMLTNNYYWMLTSILLYQFFFIVDFADGSVYRYVILKKFKMKTYSVHINYMDRVAHIVNGSLLFILLGIAIGQTILGLVTAYIYVLYKAISLNPGWYKQDYADIIMKKHEEALPRYKASKTNNWLFNFIRPEAIFSIIFWLILFKQFKIIIPIYLVIFSLELIRRTTKQFFFVWKLDNE